MESWVPDVAVCDLRSRALGLQGFASARGCWIVAPFAGLLILVELWESWHIPYYGSCRIYIINRSIAMYIFRSLQKSGARLWPLGSGARETIRGFSASGVWGL